MRVLIIDIGGESDQMLVHVEEDDDRSIDDIRAHFVEILQKAWPETTYNMDTLQIGEMERADLKEEWIPGMTRTWLFPCLEGRFNKFGWL
jgi:hypothetical protein